MESVIYCPHVTEGGVFIRPKYHNGDRAGSQTFPHLRYICMNFDKYGDLKLPVEYDWHTPALKVLAIRMDASIYVEEDVLKAIAKRCYDAYPETMERVDFIAYPAYGSKPYTRLDQLVPFKSFNR